MYDPAGEGLEHGKATLDIAMESLDVPVFRSCVGTLLCVSQHRSHIPHTVRNLCQWVAKRTKPAMDGVTHWVVQGHFKHTPYLFPRMLYDEAF